MKKQILSISILLLFALLSCSKDEDNDSGFDLKAYKMNQVGYLFESMARQPEKADVLIKAAENNYSSYTELLPLCDKNVEERAKARGAAFGLLFESVARQPELFGKLDSAAEKFLGKYNPDYINDDMEEITSVIASPSIYESIARQPEADSLFNVICKKYLNFEFLSKEKK